MTATTPVYALTYPELTDAPDLPTQLQQFDDDVNAALDALAPDSGVQTNVLAVTAASGWSMTKTQYVTIGKKMWLMLSIARTGATITADAAGNIVDTLVATITDASKRPTIEWYGMYRAGLTSGAVEISPLDGTVQIDDAHSTSDQATGDGILVSAAYAIL